MKSIAVLGLAGLALAGPNKGKPAGVRYMQLTALLLEDAKELEAQHRADQAPIAALSKRLARLEHHP